MQKIKIGYVALAAVCLVLTIIAFIPIKQPLPPEPMKIEITWHYALTNCETERDLARARIDIHKKQIRNLQAEIDGLRVIILGDPELSKLLDKREDKQI